MVWTGVAKTLCEWKKWEITGRIGELAAIVRDPRFVCRKCARSAHAGRHLCKPTPLPPPNEPVGEECP